MKLRVIMDLLNGLKNLLKGFFVGSLKTMLVVLYIAGGIVAFACLIYISFGHTLELFRSVGISRGKEYWAAIGAEATFFVSAIHLFCMRFFKVKPGWPAIVSAVLGLFLVGWANVEATKSYGWKGIIIGLYFPVMVGLYDAILGRMITNLSQPNNQKESTGRFANWIHQLFKRRPVESVGQLISQTIPHQPIGYRLVESQPVESTPYTVQLNQSKAVDQPVTQSGEAAVKSEINQLKDSVDGQLTTSTAAKQSTDKDLNQSKVQSVEVSTDNQLNDKPTKKQRVKKVADQLKRSTKTSTKDNVVTINSQIDPTKITPELAEKVKKYLEEKGAPATVDPMIVFRKRLEGIERGGSRPLGEQLVADELKAKGLQITKHQVRKIVRTARKFGVAI